MTGEQLEALERLLRISNYVAYAGVVIVFCALTFPQSRHWIHASVGAVRWHWRRGQWQRRAELGPGWLREALEVRGLVPPRPPGPEPAGRIL